VSLSFAGARRRPAVVGFYHSDVPGAYVRPLLRGLPEIIAGRAIDATFSFIRRRHARYRATLCASRVVADELTRHGVPRVVRVGPGVDLETFCPRPSARSERPLIVYAGRLNGEKDVATLLDAWTLLPPRLGATLLVAGSGPLVPLLAGRPGVRYLGYVG